jgi:hypothetical protein
MDYHGFQTNFYENVEEKKGDANISGVNEFIKSGKSNYA